MSKLIESQKPTVGLRFPQAVNELKLGVLLTEFGSTKDMHKILTFVCALFNSGGGTLTLFVDGHYTVSAFENLARGIEQQIKSIISGYRAFLVEITNYENLVITVNTPMVLYRFVVLRWNLFLSMNNQAKAIYPYEPFEPIAHLFAKQKYILIDNVTKSGSHLKSFTIDKKIDVHESKTVQLKYLEQMKSGHTSFADRVVSNFTKFSTCVSAFANSYGGHIYYGITHDGIVKGQLIPELHVEKDKIDGKIQKAINKMLWPGGIDHKPEKGIHWDVHYESVKDGNGDVISSVVVPVVFIAQCPGGVFTQKPESYHLVNGHVVQMSHCDILARTGLVWFSYNPEFDPFGRFLIHPSTDLEYVVSEEVRYRRSRFRIHPSTDLDYDLPEQQACDPDKSYSEYAKFDAPDSELSEMLDYCDQHPVERAFLSQEKPDLSDDCTAYLQGLDWVKDFRMVEANEEYSTRHLEIVCKSGSVPRIPDIAKHFGDDVLPFVNYEAEKDLGTFEMPEYYYQRQFARAFFSQGLQDDCTKYLQGLDWIRAFHIVEANEECRARHLEIVCKFGSVPRIADIVQHFGEGVLSFVTYKAEKGPLVRGFPCQEKQDLSDDSTEYLQGLDWIKDFNIVQANDECRARHLEIVCKFGSVPRIADIVQHFGEGVLSFVTYKAEKETDEEDDFDEQESESDDEGTDEELGSDSDEQESESDDEGTDEELKIDSDEQESESNDEETDEEPESDFDKKESELDHEEDVSPSSWFRNTVLNGNYEVRKKYKKKLQRLDWVKACGVGIPNSENNELYLLLICKKGEVPNMAQLKKHLGKEIVSHVDFREEPTFKLVMDRRGHSESFRSESSHDELFHGKSSNGESFHGELSVASKQCQAMCVRPGDRIESPNHYGSIGFFLRGEHDNKVYLSTCYHVCYSGEKLPSNNPGKTHKMLLKDRKNKDSPTRTASFWSLPEIEKEEEQSQNDVEVTEQKEGTKECEEIKINENDCSNGIDEGLEKGQEQKTKKPGGETKKLERKKIKLGPYFWGHYNTSHDIAFVELGSAATKCLCPISADHPKKEIISWNREINDIVTGKYKVQKIGYKTGITEGRVLCINYCDLGGGARTDAGLVVEDEDPTKPFALPGDSGSLVSVIKGGKEIPVAYLVIVGTNEEERTEKETTKKKKTTKKKSTKNKTSSKKEKVPIHFCYLLVNLLRECRKSKKVGKLQLYLNGCVSSGPYIKEKKEEQVVTEATTVKCQKKTKEPKSESKIMKTTEAIVQ